MRLSEAIRLGSMVHPQGFRAFKSMDYRGVISTCALGAAYEAVGLYITEFTVVYTGEEFPTLHWKSTCPACDLFNRTQTGINVAILIAHLNDNHHWTREAIADWVEQLEAQYDGKAAISKLEESNCGVKVLC